MIRWARTTARRGLRRIRLTAAQLGRRVPVVRTAAPWGLAVTLNMVVALTFILVPFAKAPRGTPDGENFVAIFVVPPAPEPVPDPVPTEQPTLERTEDLSVVNIDVETPAPPPVSEPELAAVEAEPTPPPNEAGIRLPQVALPDADSGRGAPDGLIALNCYERFADPDKAAECAGREIRSGWRAGVADIGSDWDEIAESLRRGGYEAPNYGPDPLAGMGRDTRVFEGEDVRFRNRTFDQWGRYTKSFNSPQEYREFQALRDSRRYVGEGNAIVSGYGIGETTPISGWQPSWQLRDDPNIDKRDIERLMRDDDE